MAFSLISPMANEESKNENPENQTPAEEEQPVEGLTADQAADSQYDATEVWNKSKNSLLPCSEQLLWWLLPCLGLILRNGKTRQRGVRAY